MSRFKVFGVSCVMALSLVSGACSDEHDEEDHGESIEDEGCEHIQEGPAKAVTASADTAQAPDATAEHTRIDLSLVDVEGGKGGAVQLVPDEAGDFYLFLSDDVSVTLTKAADGSVVTPELSEGAVEACAAEIPKHYVYDLEVGTYLLTVGPTTLDKVSFVFEHNAGEAHAH